MLLIVAQFLIFAVGASVWTAAGLFLRYRLLYFSEAGAVWCDMGEPELRTLILAPWDQCRIVSRGIRWFWYGITWLSWFALVREYLHVYRFSGWSRFHEYESNVHAGRRPYLPL